MSLKDLRLSGSSEPQPIDPIEIFNGLTLRGEIKGIWQPQAEALSGCHRAREKTDIAVQMNTGGGKTLVGLLVSQALVNELHGPVLYVCPNNQLIEQTIHQAEANGFAPASRIEGTFTRQREFELAKTFCVVNYSTVFNGRSYFKDKELAGLVFDDAHVAENLIRNAFTMVIRREDDLHGPLLNVFRRHLARGATATTFAEVSGGRPRSFLYVPAYVVCDESLQIRRILEEGGIETHSTLRYPWSHLSDHISSCTVILTGDRIEIGPATLPVSSLPHFKSARRRVYLTATMPTPVSFLRSFGLSNPALIKPEGKSGDAQRLFIFSPGENTGEQVEAAKRLVARTKSCVVSRSNSQAEVWCPPGEIYTKGMGHAGIMAFADAAPPKMLCLAARYDGIDLPGNACRVLVVHSVPSGEFLFDQFFDVGIRVEAARRSRQATRIIQAIGRIFRSNTDHGAVVVVGVDLQRWLRDPSNRSYLPTLLQQQVLLGIDLQEVIEKGQYTWEQLLAEVLGGTSDWDEFYKQNIAKFATLSTLSGPEWYLDLLQKEQAANEHLWEGRYPQAAAAFGEMADASTPHDQRLGAWYRHLQGVSLQQSGSRDHAYESFLRAADVRAELGRPRWEVGRSTGGSQGLRPSEQALRLGTAYSARRGQVIPELDAILSDLVYGDEETNRAEEAVRKLGELLGLESSRPDPQTGGPDVVWHDSGSVRGLELKTRKEEDGNYNKEEIGQCFNHEQWLLDTHGIEDSCVHIVGRFLPVVPAASPSETLMVNELDAFRELGDRTKQMYEAVAADPTPDPAERFEKWLRHYGLKWPSCVDALIGRPAQDLKAET